MERDIDSVIREFDSLQLRDQDILRDILRSNVSNYPHIELLSEQANDWLRTTVHSGNLRQVKYILNITTSKNSRGKSLKKPLIVIILAIATIFIAYGILVLSSNVICMPRPNCVIGKGVFTNSGISISYSTVQQLQYAPIYTFGLGIVILVFGIIFLVEELFKSK